MEPSQLQREKPSTQTSAPALIDSACSPAIVTGCGTGSETSLPFEIEPLFWQTAWFRVACLVLLLLSVWSVYRYRLYHLTQQFNMRLEERVGERTRIARELHDTLLQSFHGLLLAISSG